MAGLFGFVAGVLVTFLPPRYRKKQLSGSESLAGGTIQFFGAAGLLVYQYYQFAFGRAGYIATLAGAAADHLGGGAVYGSGIFVLAEAALQPLNMFLLYMLLEGLVRTLAALTSGDAPGTLPLYAISAVHNMMDRSRHKRDLGPLVMDEVIRGTANSGFDLKVYSCRPKLEWNSYVTISFEDELYQMFREEPAPAPRRFIYYLRRNPTGRITLRLLHYKIDDVLKAGKAVN